MEKEKKKKKKNVKKTKTKITTKKVKCPLFKCSVFNPLKHPFLFHKMASVGKSTWNSYLK